MLAALTGLALLTALWPSAGVLRGALLALDGLLLLACCADLALVADPERLELERDLPERVGLGRPFTRRIRLRIPGPEPRSWIARARGAARRGELREEFPASCHPVQPDGSARADLTCLTGSPELTGGPEPFELDAQGAAVLERRYAGELRGRVLFGDVRLRLVGPLGLMIRQGRFAGAQAIAVEPALLGLSQRLALAASERWRDLGVRTARRLGGATEFESLREYVAGDDVRSVDWKAFAKRGAPIVREFQEERGQELLIAIDCGRAMTLFGGAGPRRGWTKLDLALDAALQLAAVALQAGDRVGALAFDARPRAWVAARRGVRQLRRLREALFDLQAERVATDLERALAELEVRHRRRATVIVISDVLDSLSVGEQVRALRSAARGQRVVFAALDDPDVRLMAQPDGLHAAREDPELAAASAALVAERQASLHELRRSGVQVLDAVPAEGAGALIAAWLEARGRGRARVGSRSRRW